MIRLRPLLAALVVGAATLVVAAPAASQTLPTRDFTCNAAWDNGPWITNMLLTTNVRTHGFCFVDWGPYDRNPTGVFRAGVEVTNNRTLDLSDGMILLRGGQAPTTTTQTHDLVTNRDRDARGIRIVGGFVDGQASYQSGNGFDGIALSNCQDCVVDGVTVQNIRGLDTGGGGTESFALTFDSCQSNCVAQYSKVTATGTQGADTSSGFAANSSTGVTFVHDNASKVDGRGFAIWNSSDIEIRESISDGTLAHAIGLEDTHGVVMSNTWGANSRVQGGLQLKNVTGLRASGMVLAGNATYALGLNGTFQGACWDDVISGTAYAGSQGWIKSFNYGCAINTSGLVLK